MPPKGYRSLSLKQPVADELNNRAKASGQELSTYIQALLNFTENEEGWDEFLRDTTDEAKAQEATPS